MTAEYVRENILLFNFDNLRAFVASLAASLVQTYLILILVLLLYPPEKLITDPFVSFLKSMVDIFYLDYGQSECVSLDRVCNSTPGDILSRRAMAQYITLEGVQPVSHIT